MKKTLRLPILVFSLFLSPLFIFSQTGLYKTYEDYTKGNIQELKTYKSYVHVMGKVSLKFKDKDGKTLKVKCNEIWGFVYEGKLFRMDVSNQFPVRVLSTGKIIYYQNGIAHLTMIHDKKNMASFSVGYYDAVSKDLKSEIVPIPSQTISAHSGKYNEFKKKNPQYKSLFDCLEKPYDPKAKIVDCYEVFEKSDK